MLFGHVAISILQHRYLKADLMPAVAAGVFPDVVDKTLCQVLHLTPNGRMFGHTLVSLVLSTTFVGLIRGRQAALSWASGYLSHLLGDVGGFVPWLYPFARYDFPQNSFGLLEILRWTLANRAAMRLELALVVWALFALCWPWLNVSVSAMTAREPANSRCS